MASRKRQAVVGYAGVYFIEAPRAGGKGIEKVYYIRYRKKQKLIEEKVGGQYRDNMTAAKAASIRGLRVEGKDASNGENAHRLRQPDRRKKADILLTNYGHCLRKQKAQTEPSKMTVSAIICI